MIKCLIFYKCLYYAYCIYLYIFFFLAADDEISFDPGDIVTNIEMVSVK